jgi:hypothetical protein
VRSSRPQPPACERLAGLRSHPRWLLLEEPTERHAEKADAQKAYNELIDSEVRNLAAPLLKLALNTVCRWRSRSSVSQYGHRDAPEIGRRRSIGSTHRKGRRPWSAAAGHGGS